jgi:hypothetical protein
VDRNEAKTALLVEAQRRQVVVGRNEPQAAATGVTRRPLDRLDQGPADPASLLEAVE